MLAEVKGPFQKHDVLILEILVEEACRWQIADGAIRKGALNTVTSTGTTDLFGRTSSQSFHNDMF